MRICSGLPRKKQKPRSYYTHFFQECFRFYSVRQPCSIRFHRFRSRLQLLYLSKWYSPQQSAQSAVYWCFKQITPYFILLLSCCLQSYGSYWNVSFPIVFLCLQNAYAALGSADYVCSFMHWQQILHRFRFPFC